jgi:hypothetical protein
MGKGRDVSMSECGDPISSRSGLTMLMGFLGVLDGLP